MDRKERVTMDCRTMPEANCSLTISGTEDEVLEVAEPHAINKHGYKKDAGLREQLRSSLKRESLTR
ncbi:MAG: DUF1059 domain-containing protein [Elusimicrobiota bacterium]|nr:DUF1059 domain-containing protein [Elusimicrobiota bacterium]